MTVYIVIFALLALIAIAMQVRLAKSTQIALVAFAYCILVLFVGLRWETGNDWSPYYEYYTSLHSMNDNASEFEIGYRIISLALKDLGVPYQAFLLIYSALYLGLIFIGFASESLALTGWIILLFYSTFLLGWMGTARQVMALGICICSVRYILRRRPVRFLACIALASSFHATAVCFLLAWPLARVKLSRMQLWIVVILSSGAAVFNVSKLITDYVGAALEIPYFSEKLAFYQRVSVTDMDLNGGDLTILWFLKRLVFLGLFVLLFRLFENSAAHQLYFKLYLVSTLMFLLLFASVPMIPLRAGLYFSIFELFLLALVTRKVGHPALRKLYCGFLLVLAASRLYSALFLYHPVTFIPYKTQFLNEEIIRPG